MSVNQERVVLWTKLDISKVLSSSQIIYSNDFTKGHLVPRLLTPCHWVPLFSAQASCKLGPVGLVSDCFQGDLVF